MRSDRDKIIGYNLSRAASGHAILRFRDLFETGASCERDFEGIARSRECHISVVCPWRFRFLRPRIVMGTLQKRENDGNKLTYLLTRPTYLDRIGSPVLASFLQRVATTTGSDRPCRGSEHRIDESNRIMRVLSACPVPAKIAKSADRRVVPES